MHEWMCTDDRKRQHIENEGGYRSRDEHPDRKISPRSSASESDFKISSPNHLRWRWQRMVFITFQKSENASSRVSSKKLQKLQNSAWCLNLIALTMFDMCTQNRPHQATIKPSQEWMNSGQIVESLSIELSIDRSISEPYYIKINRSVKPVVHPPRKNTGPLVH